MLTTPKDTDSEFKYDNYRRLDENLKEYFILKKNKEKMQVKLDAPPLIQIRSVLDPNFRIQQKDRRH